MRGSRPPDLASAQTVRTLLTGIALLGALLLVIAEFSTLYTVTVGSLDTTRRSIRGGSNHAYALVLIALLAVPMALGARRGAGPPAYALAALGVATLVVAVGIDLPDARASGTLPEADAFEDAQAQPARGFYLETLGGVLLLAGGGLFALLRRGEGAAGSARSGRPEEEDANGAARPRAQGGASLGARVARLLERRPRGGRAAGGDVPAAADVAGGEPPGVDDGARDRLVLLLDRGRRLAEGSLERRATGEASDERLAPARALRALEDYARDARSGELLERRRYRTLGLARGAANLDWHPDDGPLLATLREIDELWATDFHEPPG